MIEYAETLGIVVVNPRQAAEELARLREDLHGLTVEIHAGTAYVEPLRAPLRELGARLSVPLGHLRQGEQLVRYGTAPVEGQSAGADGQQLPVEVAALVTALTDMARPRTPAAFLAGDRHELNQPGLYTPGGSTTWARPIRLRASVNPSRPA
ncbi:DUF6884 domain-containing protein [Candidatus Protofrankia californiensis]|uniref:DUF6884 domain-containing protein n=1 Tax=Candidatus Protofrankia californiensis TaxID=1839754 RepID=UPI00104172BE|nr:DUF6884 domain-containing protein [Candidatus Protofrankia californiensis]